MTEGERGDGPQPNDDPIQRLRAVDPAADVEPRDGFVQEVVAAATAGAGDAGDAAAGDAAAVADAADAPEAGDASGTPASPETGAADAPEAGDASAPVVDLAARRNRRRRWIAGIAAAAALVAVGGAGYAVGAGTGAQTTASDAMPEIAVSPELGGAGAQGAAGSASDGKLAADYYGGGRNSFHASGLSDAAGTATGYAYDARPAATAESAAALAAALGVAGEPVLADGRWAVGPQDGSAPYVSIGLDGTAGFFYSNPVANPWVCDDPAVPCTPTGTPPEEAPAIDALRSLIAGVGLDPDAFEYGSQTWEGSVTRTAQAWPLLNGERLDQNWNLELGEAGIVSASGALAGIVELGDYPVVSEQEGFERLSDPRFGATMGIMPLAARAETDVAQVWTPPTEAPATPGSGATISWPVSDVQIVSAKLKLAGQWQPDGAVLLVPTYEFTDADGGTWTVIAVADDKLDFGR